MKCIVILLLCAAVTQCSTPTNRELFEDKTIVITGGAGFLGKGIIKTILPYNPRKIVVFSRDEVKHFLCQQQFNNDPRISMILGDIRDYDAVLDATDGADIVIHAGAHKRIDMMESNIQECIKTNILGSMNVFNACVANNVAKAVFISTDKSASPINIYGACKFVSEKIFNNYDYTKINTAFTTVRYGNVMHSTGSVIPFFIQKITKGEPITLTDPRMTRFAISIEQAIELIFDALRYGVGGELFVRQLPAFKIVDLIDALKQKFNSDVPVIITGIRPGEKLDEVLINFSEAARTYQFKDLYVITPSLSHTFADDIMPSYIKEGVVVDSKTFGDYSSDKALIDIDGVSKLLESFNIYKKAFRNRNRLWA